MKTISTPSLPPAVASFLEAANRFDATAAAACFTADAVVHDEQHPQVGTEAIRAWIASTSARYQARATVLEVRRAEPELALTVRVAGAFAGSPLELEYTLRLHAGKIAELIIA